MTSNRGRVRRRILFLVDALDHDYQSGITHGVVRAARRLSADVMILVGGQMVFVNRHLEKRRFIYNLARSKDFDGVIILGTTLSSQEGLAAIAPLIMRFAGLPTLSIGLDIGKGSTVLVDNMEGMTTITEHMLDIHGCKRFAYISGPDHNKEAQIRLKTFKEVLAKRQISLPPEMVVVGAFTEASGEKAACQLIDERKVDVTSLDAIVAANDSMAVGVMDELKRRGIRVPYDVAIVGFDDIEAARYADTPLTTIQQPLVMQGEKAVERLLSLQDTLSGETITVSPRLIIRRSCGCGTTIESPTVSTSPPTDYADPLDIILTRKRGRIEHDLAVMAERGGIPRGWEQKFMDAVIDSIAGKGYRDVTETVAKLVRRSIETGEGAHVWATTIAALDKHLTHLVNPGTEESARVEAVLHRSRVAMSEAVEHFHASKVRELRNQTFAFNEAAIAMLTTLDAESLIEAAVIHLPKLGIDTCSISLFEKQDPSAALMKRFLVLDNKKRLQNMDTFPSSTIAAPEIIESRPHALVVEPLCFYDDIFGVAALEYGPIEGSIYEQLGAFFSAAVKALDASSVKTKAKQDTVSHIDSLTGLYNRNHLTYRFIEEISRAGEAEQPLSLIILDMDDFKKLNTDLGEEQGDRALVGVAETIKRCTKPTEIVARLEEDKFAILLPNTPVEKAKVTADFIKRRLKLVLAFEHHGHIAASFGITTTTAPHRTDEKTLMEAAVRALVASKRSGKDRITHIQDLMT